MAPGKRARPAAAEKPKPKKDATSKKRKPGTSAAAAASTGDRPSDEPLSRFTRWCKECGIVIHGAVEIRDVAAVAETNPALGTGPSRHSDTRATSATLPNVRHNAVFASGPVAIGDVLCSVPKACLMPIALHH
jgi:hypothetical protein